MLSCAFIPIVSFSQEFSTGPHLSRSLCVLFYLIILCLSVSSFSYFICTHARLARQCRMRACCACGPKHIQCNNIQIAVCCRCRPTDASEQNQTTSNTSAGGPAFILCVRVCVRVGTCVDRMSSHAHMRHIDITIIVACVHLCSTTHTHKNNYTLFLTLRPTTHR